MLTEKVKNIKNRCHPALNSRSRTPSPSTPNPFDTPVDSYSNSKPTTPVPITNPFETPFDTPPVHPYLNSKSTTPIPSTPNPFDTPESYTPLSSPALSTPSAVGTPSASAEPVDRFWKVKAASKRLNDMLNADDHTVAQSGAIAKPATGPPKLDEHEKKSHYLIQELLEMGKKSQTKIDDKLLADIRKKVSGRSSSTRTTDNSSFDSVFGPALASRSSSHAAESTAADNGVPSTRNPIDPPSLFDKQKEEGFVRFLRQYSSPTHNRVTAGGRIVPAGPPPKRLSFSSTNNSRHSAQKSTQFTQDFLKNVRANQRMDPETNKLPDCGDVHGQYGNEQDEPSPLLEGYFNPASLQGPVFSPSYGFPVTYPTLAGIAPYPTGLFFNNGNQGYTVVPTQGLSTHNNTPFPGWSAPLPQQYPTTNPTPFGQQIPFANVPYEATNATAAMPNVPELLEKIEQHRKTLETDHARIERWFALNGPSLSEPTRNEFYGQRRNYNIGKANLRTLKENVEKLPKFHTVHPTGVSRASVNEQSHYGGDGSRLPAITRSLSGTLNIWGERVIDRPSKRLSANTRFPDAGPIPFTLGAERNNAQTNASNGFQDLGAQPHDASVHSWASKHSDEGSESGDQATPTASQNTPKPIKQSGPGVDSLQSSEEKAKEWARRCHARGIKIESPSEQDAPWTGTHKRVNTGSSSGYIPIGYEGDSVEGNVSDQNDTFGEPLADRSNEQDKTRYSQYTDSGEVVFVYRSPEDTNNNSADKQKSRLNANTFDGGPRMTEAVGHPVSENRSTAKRSLRDTYNSRYFEKKIGEMNEEFRELNVSPIEFEPSSRSRGPPPRIPQHRFLDGTNDETSLRSHFVEDWEREAANQNPDSSFNGPHTESGNIHVAAARRNNGGSHKARKTSTGTRAGKTRYTAMQDNATASGAMGSKPQQTDAQKEFLRNMLKNPRYSAAGEGDFDFQAAVQRELRQGYKPRAQARTEDAAEMKPNNDTSAISSMGPPPHFNKTVYDLAASVGMTEEYHSLYDGSSEKTQSAKAGGTDPKSTIGSSRKTDSARNGSATTSQTDGYEKFGANMTVEEKEEKIAHHKEVSDFFKQIREEERKEIASYKATQKH
ncbi:MAG: hypothetical protein M1812_002017 [Candelaria pacifica]|nr:MAG: hypothetical protein M1812_002017 [Candelaria pacifica]